MSTKTITVYQLSNYLKQKLASDNLIQNLNVEGEISNLTKHSSGHYYFTLKDNRANIKCVMFKSNVLKLKNNISDGDKVIVKGSIALFELNTQIQLYITNIIPFGVGDLFQKFLEIKQNLFEKGYFDSIYKKAIPKYPMNIGMVVGANTAAREDIVKTIALRWPIAKIFEFNAIVQGSSASKSIIDSLLIADKKNLDVIILARGGGSLEDLFCFNDVDLAKTIFNCKTPIVTGIGHEIDFTIADYVADLRCATPTAAAEKITPNYNDVNEVLLNYESSIKNIMEYRLSINKNNLNNLKNSIVFTNPEFILQDKILQLNFYGEKINRFHTNFLNYVSKFDKTKHYFLQQLNKTTLTKKQIINELENILYQKMKQRLDRSFRKFVELSSYLDAFSPLKSLQRGYGLIYKDNKLIRTINEVKYEDILDVKISDGILKAKVIKKEQNYE